MATYGIKATKSVPGAQMYYMAHFDEDLRDDRKVAPRRTRRGLCRHLPRLRTGRFHQW